MTIFLPDLGISGVPEGIRSKAETFLDKPLLDAPHGFVLQARLEHSEL